MMIDKLMRTGKMSISMQSVESRARRASCAETGSGRVVQSDETEPAADIPRSWEKLPYSGKCMLI